MLSSSQGRSWEVRRPRFWIAVVAVATFAVLPGPVYGQGESLTETGGLAFAVQPSNGELETPLSSQPEVVIVDAEGETASSDSSTQVALSLQRVSPLPLASSPQELEGDSIQVPFVEIRADPSVSDLHIPAPAWAQGNAPSPASASINVTYNGFTPEAQSAFEYAAGIWEAAVNSPVTIEVTANWSPLGSNVLGSAGACTYRRNFPNAPLADTWYPLPLADALAGVDLDPGSCDLTANFSSNFTNWYFGTDGNTPSNKYDFVTVVMHELGHGLGFAGSMRSNVPGCAGAIACWGGGTPFAFVYDAFTRNAAQQPLTSFASGSGVLLGYLTSGNILFTGPEAVAANGGASVRLYAPGSWNQGSSYSHLDETFNGTANALMTFSVSNGESLHSPGPVILGMFRDFGWTTNAGTGGSPGSLQFQAASASSAESTATVNIAVTRTGGSAGAVGATCQVTGGTATAGTDYTLSTGSVAYGNGATTAQNCVVTVLNDAAFEGDESVVVSLIAPTGGATLGAQSTFTLTITDNDVAQPGTLQFQSPSASSSEATPSVSIPVTRTGGADGAVGAICQVSGGSATEGSDYTLTTNSISFGNGVTTAQSCAISVANDTAIEGNETVLLTLTGPSGGATIGGQASFTLTITDDELPQPAILQFQSAAASSSEPAATVNAPVTRTGGTASAASATCQVSGGTATPGSDYLLTVNAVAFASGVTAAQNCVITVLNDNILEGPESVILSLQAPVGATIGSPSVFTLTITDDDVPQPGTLQFQAASASSAEATASVSIPVTRSGGSDGAVGATCQVSGGSASAGADYTVTTGSVSFPNGLTVTKHCLVTIVNDAIFEASETVTLTLSAPTGGATIGGQVTFTLTITDDDVARPGALQFQSAGTSRLESAGTIAVAVIRSGGSDGPATVICEPQDGNDSDSGDFVFFPDLQTLTWADGDGSPKFCSLTLTDDSTPEPNEDVVLRLSSWTGAAPGATSVHRVLIVDNDAGGAVLTCNGGLTRTVSGGTATFSGCRVSAPGVFRLIASAGAATFSVSEEFTISELGPELGSMTPAFARAGGSWTGPIRLLGSGFGEGATVHWDGVPRAATFVSSSEVRFTLNPADYARAGAHLVTVSNVGSGPSGPLEFAASESSSADVTCDGAVTANDPLFGLGVLAGTSEPKGCSLDVNRDGVHTPLDSLYGLMVLARILPE